MVRDAQLADIPQLVGLIEDFYGEAPYDTPDVNPDKCDVVLTAYIEASYEQAFCKVIDIGGGKLGGFMIGERFSDLWSDAQRSVEIALYVLPQHRGRLAAGKLLISFAHWAEAVPGVVRVEASSGITDEQAARVYAKLGWEPRGTLHGRELLWH